MPYMVENIVRNGEIACYKKLLLFHNVFQPLYIFTASESGIVWYWVNNHEEKTLKTLWREKHEMLVSCNFSFLPNIFYPVKNKFFSHICLVIGKCFQFEPVYYFVLR